MENKKHAAVAYTLLRVAMGVNLLGHGAVRIPKLESFSDWMVSSMAKGWLPETIVKPFALVLPFAELIIGLLLTIGLFTCRMSIAGAILIILLLFGCSTIENWEAMGIQMIYVIFYYLLIIHIADNKYSLDQKFFNK